MSTRSRTPATKNYGSKSSCGEIHHGFKAKTLCFQTFFSTQSTCPFCFGLWVRFTRFTIRTTLLLPNSGGPECILCTWADYSKSTWTHLKNQNIKKIIKVVIMMQSCPAHFFQVVFSASGLIALVAHRRCVCMVSAKKTSFESLRPEFCKVPCRTRTTPKPKSLIF